VQQRTFVLGQVQAENKQMQTMRAAFACHTQEPHLGTNFDREREKVYYKTTTNGGKDDYDSENSWI